MWGGGGTVEVKLCLSPISIKLCFLLISKQDLLIFSEYIEISFKIILEIADKGISKLSSSEVAKHSGKSGGWRREMCWWEGGKNGVK